MLLSRFEPFLELEKNFYNYPNTNEVKKVFVPIVNTREAKKAYHINVDLPGVKKEDIKVDMNKELLTISGERKTKDEIQEEDYYKLETTFGKFSRSFTLPEDIDIENIEAKNDNGVLEIIIPKLKEAKINKTIEIK